MTNRPGGRSILMGIALAVPVIMVTAGCASASLRADDEPADQNSVTVDTRESLIAAVRQAGPGTTVRVAPGTYRGGLSFDRLRGGAGRPIVIAALDENDPPVFEGGGSGIHLRRPVHVELRNLVIQKATGNGLNIDDGGADTDPAHHVVLRALQIRDIGPGGNRDGIKLSGVDEFVVTDCVIQRWGDGGSAIDMVGCQRGKIEGCAFTYRGEVAANGVQTKGGSSDIVISRCRFENAGSRAVNIGGSTGRPYFRPAEADYEAKDITVEDCTFIGSAAPICFVGVDGATVQYNTIYRPARWVLRILQESQQDRFVPARGGVFRNNLIAFRAGEIRETVNIGGGTAPQTFTFEGNHWYCLDAPTRSDRLGLPVAETGGTYGAEPRFVDESTHDLRLKDDSPVRNAGVRPRDAGGD
jgi:hypothetical protein